MALSSGGSPMFPLVVHQPASPSIWPEVQSLRRVCPQIQGRQCGAYVGAVEEMMCVMCVGGCYRGGIVVMDVFWR